MTIQRLSLTIFSVFAFAATAVRAAATPPAKPAVPENTGPERLVIVGDSTACIYDQSMPYRGWGMFIPYYLRQTLEVVNLARPGRSVSTYMLEGSWKGALKEKPKFILIQFGTNDSHDQHSKEGVDAEVSYPMFLNKYINAALSISAIPVLISPAHPRIFNTKGKMLDVLGPYERSMRDVAQKRGVAMVDLYTASAELYEQLGEQASKQFEPMKNDTVHFNVLGAKTMAELIMRRLVKVEPRIVPYLGPDPMVLSSGQEAQAQQ
jgi:lysophospholipase L1-like esterase